VTHLRDTPRVLKEVPNLDVLRSVAVLLVVVDHSAKFFGAPPAQLNLLGVTGVYLFFVHTSLVLMFSLERDQAKASHHFVAKFYLRRFFRIYPLSMFFVVLVTVLSIPAKNIAGPFSIALQAPDVGNILSNLALTMNLTAHTPILGQLWSLPLEVQMYVLLPAAYLLSKRYGVRCALALWIIAVAIAVAQPLVPLRGEGRMSLIQYIPCFMPGVIAYSLWRVRPCLPGALWLPVLFALCSGYYLIGTRPTSWFMCLAVGLLAPFFHQVTSRWLTVPAHYIAKYSYGVYLGHVLALWLGFNALKLPGLIQAIVWLTSLVVIPVVVYHAIESPCIALGARLARHNVFSHSKESSATLA
jgi:peptidoglycan/LPS O-acetylase OafA/YrhL